MRDITEEYAHPAKRLMNKMANMPPVSTYDQLRNKCAILFKQSGYGSRIVWPRHGNMIRLLRHHFGPANSIIDLGTDGNGQLVRLLSRGGELRDQSKVRPFDIVHGTDWLIQIHMPAIRDVVKPMNVPVCDKDGFVLNADGIRVNEVKGEGDRKPAMRFADTQIFPFSYQELNKIETCMYDVVLSLHVLNCMFTWDDAAACVEEMKRIARMGVIISTSSGGDGSDIAKLAGFDRLQRIGIQRSEWDQFFLKHGFNRALHRDGKTDTEHYIWHKIETDLQSVMNDDEPIVQVKRKKRKKKKRTKKVGESRAKRTRDDGWIVEGNESADGENDRESVGDTPIDNPEELPRAIGPLDLLDGE